MNRVGFAQNKAYKPESAMGLIIWACLLSFLPPGSVTDAYKIHWLRDNAANNYRFSGGQYNHQDPTKEWFVTPSDWIGRVNHYEQYFGKTPTPVEELCTDAFNIAVPTENPSHHYVDDTITYNPRLKYTSKAYLRDTIPVTDGYRLVYHDACRAFYEVPVVSSSGGLQDLQSNGWGYLLPGPYTFRSDAESFKGENGMVPSDFCGQICVDNGQIPTGDVFSIPTGRPCAYQRSQRCNQYQLTRFQRMDDLWRNNEILILKSGEIQSTTTDIKNLARGAHPAQIQSWIDQVNLLRWLKENNGRIDAMSEILDYWVVLFGGESNSQQEDSSQKSSGEHRRNITGPSVVEVRDLREKMVDLSAANLTRRELKTVKMFSQYRWFMMVGSGFGCLVILLMAANFILACYANQIMKASGMKQIAHDNRERKKNGDNHYEQNEYDLEK